jgi:hypothetical protein
MATLEGKRHLDKAMLIDVNSKKVVSVPQRKLMARYFGHA